MFFHTSLYKTTSCAKLHIVKRRNCYDNLLQEASSLSVSRHFAERLSPQLRRGKLKDLMPFCFSAGADRPLTKQRTMSRWPSRQVISLTGNPAKQRCTATAKTSKQTDFSAIGPRQGRSTIKCDRHACAGLAIAGQRLPNTYRSGVSGYPLPVSKTTGVTA